MQLQAFERLCSSESRCWGLAQTAESSGKTQSINCNAWDLSNTFWSLSQPTQPWVDPRSKLRQSEARRPGSRKLTFMIHAERMILHTSSHFYTVSCAHCMFSQSSDWHVQTKYTRCLFWFACVMFVFIDLTLFDTVAVRPLSMRRLSSCAFPTVASSSMKLDVKCQALYKLLEAFSIIWMKKV